MLQKFRSFLFILTFIVRESQSTTTTTTATTTNESLVTPVIGILTQPLSSSLSSSSSDSYVAGSYVKWIEAGGGQIIAIPYNSAYDQLVAVMNQIDGILFPGGGGGGGKKKIP
jgi:hypothetical protein